MSDSVDPKMLRKVLLENNLITEEELSEIEVALRQSKMSFRELLIEKGHFTSEEFSLMERIASLKKQESLLGERYELLGKIGRGGMGHVFKARDTATDEIVAIKVLDEELSEDPAFVARFRREVEMAYHLEHPNIVRALDTGKDGDSYYLVMEFVDGIPLSKILLQETRIDENEAMDIIDQLAQALEHFYQKDFVHRDIKPDNILVLSEGKVKLIDMGLVRSTEQSNLTMTGSVLGTPHYLSPEQARGEKDIDIRSDIYSLGATFFHMTVGRTPFSGDNPLEVINHHINSQIPQPMSYNPNLSQHVSSLIQWMMEKDRQERPQKPTEVRHRIEEVRSQSRSVWFKIRATQLYQPTKYFQEGPEITEAPRYNLGVRQGLVFALTLLLMVAGGVYLWGSFFRQNIMGKTLAESEQEARKVLKKAEEKLETQDLEMAFYLYRDLFKKHSQTEVFSQEKKRILGGAQSLMKEISSRFSEVDIHRIMGFAGKLQKRPGKKGYRITYDMENKKVWKDWERLAIPSSPEKPEAVSLDQKLSLLRSKLRFARVRQANFEFTPDRNGIIGLSLKNIHILLRVREGKILLWKGAFQLPQSKFDVTGIGPGFNTSGNQELKVHRQDVAVSPRVPETLTINIREETKGEDKIYFIEALLQNSSARLQVEVQDFPNWGKEIPLFLRYSPGVKIEQISLEGDLNQKWLESILEAIFESWLSQTGVFEKGRKEKEKKTSPGEGKAEKNKEEDS